MLAPAATETVTVLRGGRDRNGDPTGGSSHTLTGCVVQPRDGNGTGGNELTANQDTVITGLSLWAPADADLLPTDRITYRGLDYDVEGQPGVYRSFVTGAAVGVYAALRRVTG